MRKQIPKAKNSDDDSYAPVIYRGDISQNIVNDFSKYIKIVFKSKNISLMQCQGPNFKFVGARVYRLSNCFYIG